MKYNSLPEIKRFLFCFLCLLFYLLQVTPPIPYPSPLFTKLRVPGDWLRHPSPEQWDWDFGWLMHLGVSTFSAVFSFKLHSHWIPSPSTRAIFALCFLLAGIRRAVIPDIKFRTYLYTASVPRGELLGMEVAVAGTGPWPRLFCAFLTANNHTCRGGPARSFLAALGCGELLGSREGGQPRVSRPNPVPPAPWPLPTWSEC